MAINIKKVMRNYPAMVEWIGTKGDIGAFYARRITGSFVLAYKYQEGTMGRHIPVGSVAIVQCYLSHAINQDLDSDTLAYITPQHKVVFVVDPNYYVDQYNCSSMRSAIAKVIPVNVYIDKRRALVNTGSKTYPLEVGLTFNYFTWGCYNSVPLEERPSQPIPEVRREWLRDLKKFKTTAKALCRLGVVAAELERSIAVEEVTFGDPNLGNVLIEVVRTMRSGDPVNPLLLRFMVQNQAMGFSYLSPPAWALNVDKSYDEVERFLTFHSKRLREMYGVFGDKYKLVLE